MPEITNSTMRSVVERFAEQCNLQGVNWGADASAASIVRFILIESGDKDAAESSEPAAIEHRKALVAVIKPFMTAPKNVQNTYLAKTKTLDGKDFIMAEAKGIETRFDV